MVLELEEYQEISVYCKESLIFKVEIEVACTGRG